MKRRSISCQMIFPLFKRSYTRTVNACVSACRVRFTTREAAASGGGKVAIYPVAFTHITATASKQWAMRALSKEIVSCRGRVVYNTKRTLA